MGDAGARRPRGPAGAARSAVHRQQPAGERRGGDEAGGKRDRLLRERERRTSVAFGACSAIAVFSAARQRARSACRSASPPALDSTTPARPAVAVLARSSSTACAAHGNARDCGRGARIRARLVDRRARRAFDVQAAQAERMVCG